MGLLSALLPLLAAAAPASSCEPIAGWERLLAASGKRYIVLGEIHGTEESPQLFGDAVCLTGRTRPLVVALEISAADQDKLDAYLASDGGEAARAALLRASHWTSADGRASRAMMGLIERLRQLHQAGAVQAVIAFVPAMFPPEGYTPQWDERAMAERIMGGVPEGATVAVLVGDTHSRTSEVTFNGQTYLPMSAHFPEQETVTLTITGHGGSAWNCTRRSAGGAIECGDDGFPPARGTSPARGLVVGPPWGTPSGLLHVGGPFRASPPQNPPRIP